MLCLAYRDINLPADAVEPARPEGRSPSVDAPWQTLGGESTSSEGGEEGQLLPGPRGSPGTGTDEWQWDAGSLNAMLSE